MPHALRPGQVEVNAAVADMAEGDRPDPGEPAANSLASANSATRLTGTDSRPIAALRDAAGVIEVA
jgi:hypothetical protein